MSAARSPAHPTGRDTREVILSHARLSAQAHGYAGLSFRELAHATGIKSASVHYHFPTKGDLACALLRDYTNRASTDLASIAEHGDCAGERLRRYADLFRKTLENGNRMCLCACLAADHDDLPDLVRAEIAVFADVNVRWLTEQVAKAAASPQRMSASEQAQAIYAAIIGAQLIARASGQISLFDQILETYRQTGLLPD